MRGESQLWNVALDADRHGEGLTTRSGKRFDDAFLAFAGPWAEARHRWGDRSLDGEDDEGLTFEDYIIGVLLEQPSDRSALQAARAQARADGEPPGRDRPAEQVWQIELERVWPAIAAVAGVLLAGGPLTHEVVNSLVDRAFEADASSEA